jgi:hypothetical protein
LINCMGKQFIVTGIVALVAVLTWMLRNAADIPAATGTERAVNRAVALEDPAAAERIEALRLEQVARARLVEIWSALLRISQRRDIDRLMLDRAQLAAALAAAGCGDGVITDSWGTPVAIDRLRARQFRVFSCGADCKPGSLDDLVVEADGRILSADAWQQERAGLAPGMILDRMW